MEIYFCIKWLQGAKKTSVANRISYFGYNSFYVSLGFDLVIDVETVRMEVSHDVTSLVLYPYALQDRFSTIRNRPIS